MREFLQALFSLPLDQNVVGATAVEQLISQPALAPRGSRLKSSPTPDCSFTTVAKEDSENSATEETTSHALFQHPK